MTGYNALAVEPDEVSGPFFAGLAREQVLIQRCSRCGGTQLGRHYCMWCDCPRLSWIAASGVGTVHSFVFVHLAYHPAFSELPYNAAVVELSEGPRVFAGIIELAPGQLRTGLPVHARFKQQPNGSVILAFSPVLQERAA